ncbi:MAG: hypothetical protein IPJ74_25155 [Saprospiraceae bacterium]|nr:hypothetical protein [Saprospiraceae bacterium]
MKNLAIDNQIQILTNVKDFASKEFEEIYISQKDILQNPDFAFNVSKHTILLDKIYKNTLKLEDVINFNQGIITGDNKKYITSQNVENTKPVLTGADFQRYLINNHKIKYVLYDTSKLHRPRKVEIFEVPEKILLRQTGSYPICALDTNSFYTLDTVHNGLLIDDDFP